MFLKNRCFEPQKVLRISYLNLFLIFRKKGTIVQRRVVANCVCTRHNVLLFGSRGVKKKSREDKVGFVGVKLRGVGEGKYPVSKKIFSTV